MEIHDSRPVDYRWHIMMMMALWCLISAGEPHNKHFWPRMLGLLHSRNRELLFNHNARKLYIMHQRVDIVLASGPLYVIRSMLCYSSLVSPIE